MRGSVWKKKRGQSNGKQESDDDCRCPQPPFPPLNPPKVRAEGRGLCILHLAHGFFFAKSQSSPVGVPFFPQTPRWFTRDRVVLAESMASENTVPKPLIPGWIESPPVPPDSILCLLTLRKHHGIQGRHFHLRSAAASRIEFFD